MVDLSQKMASETAEMEVTELNGEVMRDEAGKPVTITFYGPGSREYARANNKRQNKVLQRVKKKGHTDLSVDEQNAEQAEFLASITASFNGLEYNGKSGLELFKAVYSEPRLHYIRDQGGAFVGDWENFTGKSSES